VGSDGLGLLLLAVALLIALLGTWDVIVGRARADELRERALGAPPRSPLEVLWSRLEAAVARTGWGRKLSVRLIGAGVGRTPLQFVLIALALAIVAYVASTLVVPPLIALLVALIVLRGAFGWLERKRLQRRDAFAGQLPELARLLSNGTSAGLGVNAALDIAARELNEPASAELTLVLEQVRIGASFDRAMESLAERMPSRELGVLVNTLVVQQRAGGDLVRALGDMALTLDARKDTIREIKTLMAGAVATAYTVAALGVVSIFFINLVRPGSLDNLTHSTIGLVIVALATILYFVAFVAIRRITRVET
jgi:tight adherence protein B